MKNGSKTRFSKTDLRPLGVHKQLKGAHYEPVLTEFSPFRYYVYAPSCALLTYIRAVWWSHLELGREV